MAARNYSLASYLNRLAEERKPALAFAGAGKQDWERRRGQPSATLRELCGE